MSYCVLADVQALNPWYSGHSGTVFYEDDRYYVMYTAMGVDPVLPVLKTLAVTTVTLPALVN